MTDLEKHVKEKFDELIKKSGDDAYKSKPLTPQEIQNLCLW